MEYHPANWDSLLEFGRLASILSALSLLSTRCVYLRLFQAVDLSRLIAFTISRNRGDSLDTRGSIVQELQRKTLISNIIYFALCYTIFPLVSIIHTLRAL